MQEKMEDSEFTNDMQPLLHPGVTFNASDAYPLIYETFIDRMEGKRDYNFFSFGKMYRSNNNYAISTLALRSPLR